MTERARIWAILSLNATEGRSLDVIAEKYGYDAQVAKMGEEGAELAAAVLKHISRRDSKTWDQIVEEMVDVYLLICQVVRVYFTGNDDELFSKMKDFKLNRELERIENAS